MSSILSIHIKRLNEVLRKGAEEQVDEFGGKLEAAKGLYEDFISSLIVAKFSFANAYETALEMFGSSKVKFAAIDGSQDQRLIAGLAVFWGGAYASTGMIEFKPDKPPLIEYYTGFVEQGKGVSSCIPIYIDRIHEVDQMVLTLTEPGQTAVTKPLTEQGAVDNSSIASWVMMLSELYLAYKMVAEENVKILFLDRSLSGMQTSLVYDTSKRTRWKTDGAIHGLEIDGLPIDVNEMGYGRHYIVNNMLRTPSARGDYIRYAIIYLLQQKGPMTLDEICLNLGIKENDRINRVVKYVDKSVNEGYLLESGGKYSINSRYADSWIRIKKLVKLIGDKLFESKSGNPMQIKKGNSYQWLTTHDLAFLCLYCLYMLIEECWNRKALLIGLTKDTMARDFKNHVIPICINEGIWKVDGSKLKNIPNTDRMLLQAISLFNCDEIPIPWSLIEYDSAFQTIVPDFNHRKGFVSGAIKNRIIPERLFVKTYIQLDESKRDPQLRSNVLLIDRLVYPEYDLNALINFKHEYGGAVEPIEVILYRDNKVPNKLQNLIMIVLKAMGAKSIPEVFGHNKPLFIADKIAKAQRQRMEGLINAAAHWLMNNYRLRKFSFYMHTFRERRVEVEYARRREA
jgi:hypothetical protein